MKRNFLIIVLTLLFGVILGGYFLITRNQEGIKRVDAFSNPGQSENPATKTSEAISNIAEPMPETSSRETGNQVADNTTQSSNQTVQQTSNEPLPTTGDTAGNNTSNMVNGGNIASDGEWDYIRNPEDNKLYRIKSDGSEIYKIMDDGACYINLTKDWIYYIKRFQDAPYYGGIFRIKKNGTEQEELISDSCNDLIIIGEFIYFINTSRNCNVYRMKTDGTNLECFLDKVCDRIEYDNGFLYYKIYPDLYRVNVNNIEDQEKIIDGIETYIVYNNSVYFTQSDSKKKLQRLVIGNQDFIILNENVINPYFISNDKIYFMTQEQSKIFTMELSGENVLSLPDGNYQPIRRISAVVGDMVYYWAIFDSSEAGMDRLARISTDGSINELIPDKVGY